MLSTQLIILNYPAKTNHDLDPHIFSPLKGSLADFTLSSP